MQGARDLLKHRLYACLLDQVFKTFDEEEAVEVLLSTEPVRRFVEEAKAFLRKRIVEEVVESLTEGIKEDTEETPEHLLALALDKVVRKEAAPAKPTVVPLQPEEEGPDEDLSVPELDDISLYGLEVDAWQVPDIPMDDAYGEVGTENEYLDLPSATNPQTAWYGERDLAPEPDGVGEALPDFLQDYNVESVTISMQETGLPDSPPHEMTFRHEEKNPAGKGLWGNLFSWRKSKGIFSDEVGRDEGGAVPAEIVLYGLYAADTEMPPAAIDLLETLPVQVFQMGDLLAVVDERGNGEDGRSLSQENYQSIIYSLQEARAFLPFPYGTSFHDETVLEAALLNGHDAYLRQLKKLGEHEEWWITVTRDSDTLRSRVVETSMKVKNLLESIKNDPGASQHKKDMISVIREEVDRFSDECLTKVHDELLAIAVEGRLVVEDEQADPGDVILKARYLLRPAEGASFSETVKGLEEEYSAFGFMMRAVGPRVPYSFLATHVSL